MNIIITLVFMTLSSTDRVELNGLTKKLEKIESFFGFFRDQKNEEEEVESDWF